MAAAAQAKCKTALRAVLSDPNSVNQKDFAWAPGSRPEIRRRLHKKPRSFDLLLAVVDDFRDPAQLQLLLCNSVIWLTLHILRAVLLLRQLVMEDDKNSGGALRKKLSASQEHDLCRALTPHPAVNGMPEDLTGTVCRALAAEVNRAQTIPGSMLAVMQILLSGSPPASPAVSVAECLLLAKALTLHQDMQQCIRNNPEESWVQVLSQAWVHVMKHTVTQKEMVMEGVECFCSQVEEVVPHLKSSLPDVFQLVEVAQATPGAFQLGKAIASNAPQLISLDLATRQADGFFRRLVLVWRTSQAIPIFRAIVNSFEQLEAEDLEPVITSMDEFEDGNGITLLFERLAQHKKQDIAAQLISILLENVDIFLTMQKALQQLRQLLLQHHSLVAIYCNKDLEEAIIKGCGHEFYFEWLMLAARKPSNANKLWEREQEEEETVNPAPDEAEEENVDTVSLEPGPSSAANPADPTDAFNAACITHVADAATQTAAADAASTTHAGNAANPHNVATAASPTNVVGNAAAPAIRLDAAETHPGIAETSSPITAAASSSASEAAGPDSAFNDLTYKWQFFNEDTPGDSTEDQLRNEPDLVRRLPLRPASVQRPHLLSAGPPIIHTPPRWAT